MRLAVLSDIHGNLDALQAVLADLQAAGGADNIWVLGDLAAFGPDPAACIQAVRDIPDVKVIQGNTDLYIVTGVRPRMPNPTEENWGSLQNIVLERDDTFRWTMSQLAWQDAEYLMKLGTDLSLEVEDFGWVVGFHAIPGDDEFILSPDASDNDIRDALLDREGNLAFGGHTHLPMNRNVGVWRMVNPGSVGFPFDGDTRAAYAIATFEDGAVSIDLHRVQYDVESVINKLKAIQHPMLDTMTRRLLTAKP